MATTKPRITITLTERQHQLLKSISSSNGQSMSAIVSDLLSAAEPTMERMATTFLKLKAISDQQKQRFSDSLEKAHASVEPLAVSCLQEFDGFLDTLEKISMGEIVEEKENLTTVTECDERSDRVRGSGMKKAISPSTNRGVTNPRQKQRKAMSHKS